MTDEVETLKEAYKAKDDIIGYQETIIKANKIAINQHNAEVMDLKSTIDELREKKQKLKDTIAKDNAKIDSVTSELQELIDLLEAYDIKTKRSVDTNRIEHIDISLSEYTHKKSIGDKIKTVLFMVIIIGLGAFVYYINK